MRPLINTRRHQHTKSMTADIRVPLLLPTLAFGLPFFVVLGFAGCNRSVEIVYVDGDAGADAVARVSEAELGAELGVFPMVSRNDYRARGLTVLTSPNDPSVVAWSTDHLGLRHSYFAFVDASSGVRTQYLGRGQIIAQQLYDSGFMFALSDQLPGFGEEISLILLSSKGVRSERKSLVRCEDHCRGLGLVRHAGEVGVPPRYVLNYVDEDVHGRGRLPTQHAIEFWVDLSSSSDFVAIGDVSETQRMTLHADPKITADRCELSVDGAIVALEKDAATCDVLEYMPDEKPTTSLLSGTLLYLIRGNDSDEPVLARIRAQQPGKYVLEKQRFSKIAHPNPRFDRPAAKPAIWPSQGLATAFLPEEGIFVWNKGQWRRKVTADALEVVFDGVEVFEVVGASHGGTNLLAAQSRLARPHYLVYDTQWDLLQSVDIESPRHQFIHTFDAARLGSDDGFAVVQGNARNAAVIRGLQGSESLRTETLSLLDDELPYYRWGSFSGRSDRTEMKVARAVSDEGVPKHVVYFDGSRRRDGEIVSPPDVFLDGHRIDSELISQSITLFEGTWFSYYQDDAKAYVGFAAAHEDQMHLRELGLPLPIGSAGFPPSASLSYGVFEGVPDVCVSITGNLLYRATDATTVLSACASGRTRSLSSEVAVVWRTQSLQHRGRHYLLIGQENVIKLVDLDSPSTEHSEIESFFLSRFIGGAESDGDNVVISWASALHVVSFSGVDWSNLTSEVCWLNSDLNSCEQKFTLEGTEGLRLLAVGDGNFILTYQRFDHDFGAWRAFARKLRLPARQGVN